jgi:hypothetical protein
MEIDTLVAIFLAGDGLLCSNSGINASIVQCDRCTGYKHLNTTQCNANSHSRTNGNPDPHPIFNTYSTASDSNCH